MMGGVYNDQLERGWLRGIQGDEESSIKFPSMSRVMRETHCCLTRGIVLGLRSESGVGGECGRWMGTLTGLEKGVIGA